jgi:succinate-semialdehyde dehydrogenase/glutarate-semialdehyde dehydrogenase
LVAQTPLDIYTDRLVNGFVDWSWIDRDLFQRSVVVSGSAAIRATGNASQWPALSFRHEPFNARPYQSLVFRAHGSTTAGRAIAALAGAALKKTVLELGGSDPYVILEDADLDQAAETCANARLINTGQSCIAAKRFIVVEQVRDEFEARLLEQLQTRNTGDPRNEQTLLGPLARHDLRDRLHAQVQASLRMGARCLCGGFLPEGPGAFYPPTLLTDVRPGMPVFDEETFGPVAAVVPARDEADAIRLANQSPYGLGAAIFTRDIERGERLAREHLEAGICTLNDFVRSDPRLPFGGIKDSGYGRELGLFGFREFLNVKTVCVR